MQPPEKENTDLSNLPHTSGHKNGTWLPMAMAVVILIAFCRPLPVHFLELYQPMGDGLVLFFKQ